MAAGPHHKVGLPLSILLEASGSHINNMNDLFVVLSLSAWLSTSKISQTSEREARGSPRAQSTSFQNKEV